MVYRASGPAFQLTWFDRKGNVLGKAAEPGLYSNVALAPDATRAVAARGDIRERSLWLIDFARDATTRFTLTPYAHDYPVWSPDGKRLIFASTYSPTGGHLFQKILGEAQEETLSDSANTLLPTSWSRDGRWLLYTLASQTTRNDVWVMPLTGGEKPRRLLGTEFDESEARFAPDGHWREPRYGTRRCREELYVAAEKPCVPTAPETLLDARERHRQLRADVRSSTAAITVREMRTVQSKAVQRTDRFLNGLLRNEQILRGGLDAGVTE